MTSAAQIQRGSDNIVIECDDFSATLDFYTNELGFRIDSIYPADSPRVAEISGFGACVRLERSDGTESSGVTAGDCGLVVSTLGQGDFGAGRAGMQYRDLIPNRFGGRFIASHIRIADGGPVEDYVHHHDIQFQLIFCVAGWVRVVYEDQGPPMLLQAGDCFLQPPHIRHRVLESSAGLEVVEIASPAEHKTFVEHDMVLPTRTTRTDRTFGGQRFIFDRSRTATWLPWEISGISYRDTGIAAATEGTGSAIVLRADETDAEIPLEHDAEIRFVYVLRGRATLASDNEYDLKRGDAFALPPQHPCTLLNVTGDFECLEVMLPSRGSDR